MATKTHRELIDGWVPHTDEEIREYVSKGIWHNITVGDILDRNARNNPDKLAMADDTVEVTWKQLQQRVNRIALHLKKLGVEYSDFFVVQLPNMVEFYYLFFALSRIGAVPIMCLPRHRKAEISHVIKLHQAKGIIVPAGDKFDYVGMVDEIKPLCTHFEVLVTVGGDGGPGWVALNTLLENEIERDYPESYLEQFKPDPNDICVEQITSGTTGLPKGVPATHNYHVGMWERYASTIGYTDNSVALLLTPVGHTFSLLAIAGPMFVRGGTTIITKSVAPENSFRLIEKYKITHVQLIPVLVISWIEAEEVRKKYDLSSLKLIGHGAQMAKPENVRWCFEKLGVNSIHGFGMTEGNLINTRWDSPREAVLYTVGEPIITGGCVKIKIVDDKNEDVRAGEIGELAIKGPMTFKGYFRNAEENARVFDQGGFFHTGDLVSRRPDGRYRVEGRKKDMIIRGGENIYPEPIENLLMKHPKVIYAAAVGMPDSRLGERLCAFVQVAKEQTFSFEEMKRHMNEQGVAVFQWPERLEIVSSWPLTSANKINRRLLRAHITTRLFQEGKVDKELGDAYLKGDKLTLDDILTGKVSLDFSGTTA